MVMSTLLRSAIVAVVIAVGSIGHNVLGILPWALMILTLDLVAASLLGFGAGHRRTRRNQALTVTLLGAGIAGTVIATNQAAPLSPALLLILIPAFRAGEVWKRLETPPQSPPATLAAHEAARLLRRLSDLAGTLDGGFDAPASAELLLQAVKDKIPGCRMAVLVGLGSEPAVPLALRGIDRLPWPDPTTTDSVLGRVWRTGVAEAGYWSAGNEDKAIAAAPLRDSDGARIGIVVVDRFASAPFVDGDLRALVDLAEHHSANMEVALIFAALRQNAAFEERERLAREMHDGIAQELVALGYRIDVVRRKAATQASQFAPALDEMRADLSRVLADLRLSIADLRLAVRPDQGLGAVVGARLQQFGAATGLTVGLRLSESTYRLPAHLETLIYRLILDVLTDARNARGTSTIEVRLDVKAPQAWLHISHDGESHLASDAFRDHPLAALGAEIEVPPSAKGVVVTLALNDRWPKHLPYLVPERMRLVP
jgi:signal transduction histidine kinase